MVANDLFHPMGHRIQHLLPYLERDFCVRVVSLAPPLRTKSSGSAALWWWSVLTVGESLLVEEDRIPALKRLPLPSALGPIANYLLLRKLLARSAQFRPDICLASGPVPGLAAIRTCRCPVVYEDLDCYGAYGADPFRRGAVSFIERQCLRHAHTVVSVGSVLAARARQYRCSGTHVVPNGVESRFFADFPNSPREEDLVVVHGSLEKWIGLERGLRALAILKTKGVRVRMKVAGHGPGLPRFKKLTSHLGLDDIVTFLGAIPHREIPPLLARAAVGLLCFPDTEFMRCAATLKLAECMASGLPVVATDVGETAATVRRCGAGIVVGHSPPEIAEGILSLLMGPGLRKRISRRSRRAAAQLDWARLADRVKSILWRLLEEPEPSAPPGPPARLMARA